MINFGLPYVRGYLPRGKCQAALASEIQQQLEAEPRSSPRSCRADPAPTGAASYSSPTLRLALECHCRKNPGCDIAQRGEKLCVFGI